MLIWIKLNRLQECAIKTKAWCELNGDNFKKDWDSTTMAKRRSAIKGVEFKLDNPDEGTTRNTMLDG
jgi:hypothetical protein